MARKAKSHSKSVFDYTHVKSVQAWALLWDGKEAGRIICNWTDNPNGAGCVMSVRAYLGPMKEWSNDEAITVKEGSGASGYCKFSAAFDSCLKLMPQAPKTPDLHGRGEQAVEEFLVGLGYQVIRVI